MSDIKINESTYPFLIMSLADLPDSAWEWQWNTDGTGAKHKGSFWYVAPPKGYVTLGSVFLPRVDRTDIEQDIRKHPSRPGQIAFLLSSFARKATATYRSWNSRGSGGDHKASFFVP